MANITWKEAPTEAELLAQAKSRKLAELKSAADAEVAPTRNQYPDFERETWPSQEREARAWTADNSAATPTLTDIGQARGKSLGYLAPKVIEKADQYRSLASAAAGKRQALAEAVEAATSVEEVEAINW